MKKVLLIIVIVMVLVFVREFDVIDTFKSIYYIKFSYKNLNKEKEAATTPVTILHSVVMKGWPKQRYPQALIAGVAKGGTGTLLSFIEKHPLVEAPLREIRFFDGDKLYKRGLSYYLNQMPESFENQITLEKSPGYLGYPHAPKRVFDSIKR